MKQHPLQTGPKTTKSIILYNPLSGTGHFDAWCALFCNALQERGWRVFAITPDRMAVIANISNGSFEQAPSTVTLIDRKTIFRGRIPIFSPFARWRDQLQAALARRARSALDDQASGRKPGVIPTIFASAVALFQRVANVAARFADEITRPLFNSLLIVSSTNPLAFARDVALVRRAYELDDAVVLNLYIDLYVGDAATWQTFGKIVTREWVGLSIDLSNSLPEPLLAARSRLRRILYISENTTHFPARSNKSLDYIWIPDVTSVILPSVRSDLASQIRQRAGSRKIAFLGGAIGGTKNLSMWYETMALCDPDEWFFLQVGAVNLSTLTTADHLMLERTLARDPENLLILDQYLEDEASFNELIALSTVIWGFYRDFDRSSNILAKAASFRKPIIVSANYLMGKRIRDYRIGQGVADSDPAVVAESLNELAANKIPDACFDRYLNDFGFPALSRKLDDALTQMAGQP